MRGGIPEICELHHLSNGWSRFMRFSALAIQSSFQNTAAASAEQHNPIKHDNTTKTLRTGWENVVFDRGQSRKRAAPLRS